MLLKKIAKSAAKTDFVKTAIKEKVNLDELKEKPDPKVYFGLFIIILSYILGWPAVGAFGLLAYYMEEPLIAAIGGPAIYGFSHILFWIGVYVAGAKYSKVFFQWGARIFVEKYADKELLIDIEN